MKKNLTIGYLLDFYGSLLTERQREALDMYYNMDYSLAEIAEQFSVTRQCIRGYLKNGEAHLRRMEGALNHAALYGAAEAVLKMLQEAAREGGMAEENAEKAAELLRIGMERETDGI